MAQDNTGDSSKEGSYAMRELQIGLPGRHVERPDTLDLFPSSVREPKLEGLDLYIHMYISVYVFGSS